MYCIFLFRSSTVLIDQSTWSWLDGVANLLGKGPVAVILKDLSLRWNCPTLAGGQANLFGFAPGSFFPWILSVPLWRMGMKIMASHSLAWMCWDHRALLLNAPSEKSSQFVPSPWSAAALCALQACSPLFLSVAHSPVWSLKPSRFLWCSPWCSSRRRKEGVFPNLPLVGSLLEEQWHDCDLGHGLR